MFDTKISEYITPMIFVDVYKIQRSQWSRNLKTVALLLFISLMLKTRIQWFVDDMFRFTCSKVIEPIPQRTYIVLMTVFCLTSRNGYCYFCIQPQLYASKACELTSWDKIINNMLHLMQYCFRANRELLTIYQW